MEWRHLPDFLIKHDLRAGHLVGLQGANLSGGVETLAAIPAARPVSWALEVWEWLKIFIPG
jgi:hypothetical protein